MRVVHCVCCRTILAEAVEGPYLAVCDDCVSHDRECNVESLDEGFIHITDEAPGINPMRSNT